MVNPLPSPSSTLCNRHVANADESIQVQLGSAEGVLRPSYALYETVTEFTKAHVKL